MLSLILASYSITVSDVSLYGDFYSGSFWIGFALFGSPTSSDEQLL